ncbi:MAG TPA: PEP-CTERM sorting domain-containing protein [Bryobacteraceae bacterium]|nr:PEP-CTERM sorting domain-containing protein [Bryobacteraceae bacterium]
MMASEIAAAPNTDTFVYTLHLPTVTDDVEDDSTMTEYQFSWVGPLRFNSPDNSACPTVCGPVAPGSTVADGESFDTFNFSSSDSNPEVNVQFSDFSANTFANSNTTTFTFIEPDAFWAATGSKAFPTDRSAFFVTGTAPPPPTQTLSVLTTENTAPIICEACSVDAVDIATIPEPGTSTLLAGAAGVLLLVRRRRKSF